MTGPFTPQEKTSPSAKTQRYEVGAWRTEAVRGEGASGLVSQLRQCGKAGQPRPAGIQPAALLPGGLRRAGDDSEAPGAAEALGTLQPGALVEHEHCAGSQETHPPTLPRLPRGPGLSRGPWFRPALRVPVAWDALGLVRVVRPSQYGQKSPGTGPACPPDLGARAYSSSIPEYQ